MEETGFRKISGQCRDGFLGNVKTWKTVMTYLDLNYIEDGTFGLTTLQYNQTEMKKEQLKQQAEITMRSTDKRMNKTMPVLNPLSTINKQSVTHNILIKHLTLEFEVRRSNYTDFYAKQDLATLVCSIRLDPQNILQLQNSGELT